MPKKKNDPNAPHVSKTRGISLSVTLYEFRTNDGKVHNLPPLPARSKRGKTWVPNREQEKAFLSKDGKVALWLHAKFFGPDGAVNFEASARLVADNEPEVLRLAVLDILERRTSGALTELDWTSMDTLGFVYNSRKTLVENASAFGQFLDGKIKEKVAGQLAIVGG